MILFAVFILLLVLPKSRPYVVGVIVVIALGVLIGSIMPDFFMEEPEFWIGLIACIICVIMGFISLADEEKKEREEKFNRHYGRRKD